MTGRRQRPLYPDMKPPSFHLERHSGIGPPTYVSRNWEFSYSERPGFFHQQFSQMFALCFVSYDRDQLPRPVFLHEDRSYRYVSSSRFHQPLDRASNYFAGDIVQVGFQNNDFIMRMTIPRKFSDCQAENISHLVQVLCSRTVPDRGGRDNWDFSATTACQVDCYCRACGRCEFKLDIAGLHWKLMGSENFGDRGSRIRICSAREARYPCSTAIGLHHHSSPDSLCSSIRYPPPRMSTRVSAEPSSWSSMSLVEWPCTRISAKPSDSSTAITKPAPQSERSRPFAHFRADAMRSAAFLFETFSSDETETSRALISPLSTLLVSTWTFFEPGRFFSTTSATFTRLFGLPPRSMRAPRNLSPEAPEELASIITALPEALMLTCPTARVGTSINQAISILP